jgi:hypothetical protein
MQRSVWLVLLLGLLPLAAAAQETRGNIALGCPRPRRREIVRR